MLGPDRSRARRSRVRSGGAARDYAEVWGGLPRHADRSVDVYVSRLRAKLGEALPGRDLIHTHNGIGYRFSADGRGFHILFTCSIQPGNKLP